MSKKKAVEDISRDTKDSFLRLRILSFILDLERLRDLEEPIRN